MTRVFVYSAIYGDRDEAKDVSLLDVPCYLYTDCKDYDVREWWTELGWQVRTWPSPLKPVLAAKWWKLHPWQVDQKAHVGLWLDGSIRPAPDYPQKALDALGGLDAAFTVHPWRDCLYDEFAALKGYPHFDAMTRQVERYRSEGMPERWGLFASGAIAWRINQNVKDFCWQWWIENTVVHYRDQLSLPYLLWKNRTQLQWKATLPWNEWWNIEDHKEGVTNGPAHVR